MSQHKRRQDRPALTGVHSYVYAGLAGLALWYVLSAWSFFAQDGYTDYLLAVVSGFIFVFAAVPYALSLVRRADNGSGATPARRDTFRGWASGEFETWQYRLRAANAAVEIVLPIAAVAFGMTAFGIVLYWTAPGGT